MPNKKKYLLCVHVLLNTIFRRISENKVFRASSTANYAQMWNPQPKTKFDVHKHTCILFNHICGIFACLNITTLHICWFHSIASYSHCDFSNIESRVLVHVSMGSICVCTKCIRSKEKKLWLSKAMQIEVTFRT